MNDNHELSDKERQKPSESLTPRRPILETLLLIVMIGGSAAFVVVFAYSLGSGQSYPAWLVWTGVAAGVSAAILHIGRQY